MEPWLLAAIAGGTSALAVMIVQRRSNQEVPSVLTLLRDRGPLTIPEMMHELGLVGHSAQGRIVSAIDTLVRGGKVYEHDVPPNTPALERYQLRKYSLRAS